MIETVTVSTKYQVVIPLKARQALRIKPGQRVQVVVQEDMIQLIPVKPILEYMGIAEGIDTDLVRDEEDRV